MKIAQKYSHLNGEEYLIVHHNNLYKEIKTVIKSIDANSFKTKISKEKTKIGNELYSPIELNKAFNNAFNKTQWLESRYNYYITLNRTLMEKSVLMTAKEQRKFLIDHGEKEPIYSYNQTDFVKNKMQLRFSSGNMHSLHLTYL